MEDYFIKEIVNEDGTPVVPPHTPEYEELKKKYPPCEYWGYNCMYCHKCMCGEYFKPADEKEKEIIDKQDKITHEYLMKHNPKLRERLNR